MCLLLLFSVGVFFTEATAASSSKEWFVLSVGLELLPGFMGGRKPQEYKSRPSFLWNTLLYLVCLFVSAAFIPSFSLQLSMCLLYLSPKGVLTVPHYRYKQIPHYRLRIVVVEWTGQRLGPGLSIRRHPPSWVRRKGHVVYSQYKTWVGQATRCRISFLFHACLFGHNIHLRKMGKLNIHFSNWRGKVEAMSS